jgi:prepilin signal peptidase PulO-like enzyme (type II secretory pathway)
MIGKIIAFIFGSLVGSFLNVVIYRLPLMLQDETLSLARPRSTCPFCHHGIAWYDNIPLLSYFLLKKKCRHCQHAISYRYPFVEAITILFSVIIYLLLGRTNFMLTALLFTWWLIPLAAIDLEHFILPDQLTLGLLWIGLFVNLRGVWAPLPDAVLGAALGYVLLWLINILYRMVRKREGLGQGDWKLLAAFGAWFGFIAIFYILAIAAILGAVIGAGGIFLKKAKLDTALPFGPFLCVAAWIYLLVK